MEFLRSYVDLLEDNETFQNVMLICLGISIIFIVIIYYVLKRMGYNVNSDKIGMKIALASMVFWLVPIRLLTSVSIWWKLLATIGGVFGAFGTLGEINAMQDILKRYFGIGEKNKSEKGKLTGKDE